MSRMTAIVAAGLCALCALPAAAGDQPAGAGLDVKEVLLDVYAHYRSLRTYAATTVTGTVGAMKGGTELSRALPQPPEQRATIRFARPDRVYFESERIIVVIDGEKLACGDPGTRQYLALDAAAVRGDKVLRHHMAGLLAGGSSTLLDPLAVLLHDERDAEAFVSRLEHLEARREDESGEPRIRITAGMPGDMLSMTQDGAAVIPLELWIDPERRLITRERVDLAGAMNELMGRMSTLHDRPMLRGMQYERLIMTLDLEDQQLDPMLDDAALAFDWDGEGYAMADATSPLSEVIGAWTSPLLGLPAPEIESTTLDGEPFLLSAHRGNVVLLDFWGPWCVPCVRAMPAIQDIHEHYAKAPVRVIGMCIDRGDLNAARRVLESKGVSFAQVRYASGHHHRAYDEGGIPRTVLIDQQGVVQAVRVGAGAEKQLFKQIDTLLAGGRLIAGKASETAPRDRP